MRKKKLLGKQKRTKKYFEYWDYGRLSISAAYFSTISEQTTGNKTINRKLPSGFSVHIAYEQGLDMLLFAKPKSKKKKKNKYGSARKYVKTKPTDEEDGVA